MAAPDDGLPRRAPMLFRLPRRQAPPTLPPRRRKIAVVRLGDRRGRRSGRRFLVGFLRRLRLRWLAVQFRKALKKARASYVALLRDLIDGAATIEAVHAGMLMKAYLAAPMMPITVADRPNFDKFFI